MPRGQGVAGDDVDLVIGVVGAVGRDLDAVGDQADGRAHRHDVGAVAGRGLAIDRELPFDAGHRPAVGDVLQAGQAVEELAHRGDHGRQLLGLAGRDLDLHRLADRRAGVRHPRLDPDAGDVAGTPPHLGHDLFAGQPCLPIGELEHDHAHDILVDVVAAFPADRTAGVDVLDPGQAQDAALDLAHDLVALQDRLVAASMDHDLRLLGLDLREELDPAAERGVGPPAAHDQADARHRHQQRPTDEHGEQPDIGADPPPHVGEVAVLGGGQAVARRIVLGAGAAEHGAQYRHEHHGHDQRGQERGHQRDRQIAHELADDAGPEQQRQEGRQHRGGARGHRPEHAHGRRLVGLARREALGHLAVGVLDHDGGAVDQHADGQDQREQDDDVDREPHGAEHGHGEQERDRDGETHQQRGAQAQHRHGDDHGQRHGGQHVVAEIVQHGADVLGLVLQVADLERGGPARALGLDHRADLLDGLDDVAADPLLDLERQGRAAVDPRIAFRVLEGAADLGHVAQRHDPVGGHLDGHAQHVLEVLDQARAP